MPSFDKMWESPRSVLRAAVTRTQRGLAGPGAKFPVNFPSTFRRALPRRAGRSALPERLQNPRVLPGRSGRGPPVRSARRPARSPYPTLRLLSFEGLRTGGAASSRDRDTEKKSRKPAGQRPVARRPEAPHKGPNPPTSPWRAASGRAPALSESPAALQVEARELHWALPAEWAPPVRGLGAVPGGSGCHLGLGLWDADREGRPDPGYGREGGP